MDGVHLRLARDAHDVRDVEVGLDGRAAGAHEVGFVGLGPVQRETVLLRIDRHRAQAQLGRRPHDTNGDFAAVGDEDAADPLRAGGFHLSIYRTVFLGSPAKRFLSARAGWLRS